ncbi:MAG: YitT family protein [Clostridia bacterium]|nr:YitT family protein [Clostridia bacterium]
MSNLVSTKKQTAVQYLIDALVAVIAGLVVSVAYYFFQNSNGFAPGGVGGLATMTYHLTGYSIPWAYLMLAFNIPIFILVTIFVNKKLGVFLIIYMLVQSFGTELWKLLDFKPYSLANNVEDFNIVFACIATGVISGFGFSIMLRRFGASGGTYAISALIKRANPALNVAYVSFLMDSSVVGISFFVYDMKITPVICTLVNLFIANVVVDNFLSGMKIGYKFEIITDKPEELSQELIEKLHHGVSEIKVMGMYSHTEKYMVVCIIRKKQVGEMMKIIKRYPGTFANYSKVNEVFGRFKK